MKKPDFFILGAPKCGTTSMAWWLAEHPNIYMSPVKEPLFFNRDDRWRGILSRRCYDGLFSGAGDRHIAVGEASVLYLSSREAVPNILEYADEPRFIVMVRNPVEMAPSLHAESVFFGVESECNFPTAWALQEQRQKGRKIPLLCSTPRMLLYGPMCRLGEQLDMLFRRVERKRVRVLFLEDVRENPRKEYLRVLEFLGVPDDGRASFPVHNPRKVRRSPFLGKVALMGHTAAMRTFELPHALRFLPAVLHVLRALNGLDRIVVPPSPPDPGVKAMLVDYFADDIRLLGRLLGRDLSDWLAVADATPVHRR